ncbi:bifunctional DNA primase/polymerase [Streptomyces oryzae]|uniref:Bifunctional DNA primase/polymerase n=1 Tax=Streptomyces oryzae TaxID=1434886 RepID=A0ABS3XHW7_9ACTN|nr:bifunctional DNA primase/polymerase [Streptomyces oryzae]MBO8194896.1 bifunctional DNA primase/polymerase [Streptomyces oryzae]
MPETAPCALLSAALDAAARGWHVLPLRPGTKRPALHGEGACPRSGPCATGHAKWEQRATTDPQRIRRAWSAGPFNVGIATGPSGLVVIDLDVPKDESKKDTPDGVNSFMALCERAGEPVPTTYTVRTPSGGLHLYYGAPDSLRLSNTARKLGPGIDTRAWGGYVVAPGSNVQGHPYTVLDPNAQVKPLPAWLRQWLAPTPSEPCSVRVNVPRNASAYASAALRNETANVATAPEGTRNAALTRAARALGRLVASGDLPRDQVEEALKQAGATAGLLPRECGPVITSALNWSIAHNPRGTVA